MVCDGGGDGLPCGGDLTGAVCLAGGVGLAVTATIFITPNETHKSRMITGDWKLDSFIFSLLAERKLRAVNTRDVTDMNLIHSLAVYIEFRTVTDPENIVRAKGA